MKFLNPNVDKDDIMLINMIYHPPRKDNDREDTLDIIYKTISTGEKHIKSIKIPEIEIYFAKEQYRDYTHNKTFMEIDRCDKHKCEYRKLTRYIAECAGPDYVNEYKRMLESGQFRDIQKFHTYPYVFGSDIGIEAFYRTQWLLEYDNDKPKRLTKLFLDIEVDTIDMVGFCRDGECPINAVTIIDDTDMRSYTFLLNNEKNPQIQEFINNIDDFVSELHDMFDPSYGVFDYKIFMYDSESEMLISIFKLINMLKRDMCFIWNGCGFDIPYLIARLQRLGLDPADVMCHPDFKNKLCYFKEDTKNFAIANKAHIFKLSSYTKYVDQMVLYAATRKGMSELRSHALNFIGRLELDDEKLDYTDEANIKTLPYVNYKKFVAYNIKDVLLQYGIEHKVSDGDGLYLRSYSNCTEYDSVFKQTVMLKCRAYYEYLLQGNIIGNNVNIFVIDSGGGFTGAVVGNPLLNSNTGIELFGLPSMYIFDDVIDMDFSAMYPYVIIVFNIERNTMYGKLYIEGFNDERYDHLFIDDQITDINTDDDDDANDEEYDPAYDSGKDFMDNYLTGDNISLGHKWFNLPNFTDINKKFVEKFGIGEVRHITMPELVKSNKDIIIEIED